jgi:hypothetical protein
MTIVGKEPKILISLVKNLKKDCSYPAIMVFTIVKDEESEHHYLGPSREGLINDFLNVFHKVLIKSQNDPFAYEYKIKGAKETITVHNEKPQKARDFWNTAIKDGWRPIEKNE